MMKQLDNVIDEMADLMTAVKEKRHGFMTCFSCGLEYSKAKIASHQMGCIKKKLGFSPSHKSRRELEDRTVSPAEAIVEPVRRQELKVITPKNPQISKSIVISANVRDEHDESQYEVQDKADDRVKCQHCSRKFNQEAIERHEPKCANIGKKTRKVFDSAKARIEGTQLKEFAVQNKFKSSLDTDETSPKKAAKKTKQQKAAAGGSKFEKHSETIDSVCKYCERTFSDMSLERHEPICKALKEKQKIREKETRNREASETHQMLQRRKSYKPPVPRKSK